MDAASTAFSKILHRGSKDDDKETPSSGGTHDTASVTKNTATAVEHETIRKKHEQREQKVVDKERHQDHYKTTVQPLKEREVVPEKHQYEQADIQHQHINRAGEGQGKTAHQRRQGQFQNVSKEAGTHSETIQEPTLTSDRTHHHLHETIQPVIEKETVVPSVTHKTIPIKEHIQEPTLDEGVTINPPMSREEFERRMRK
ncbi:hypothetical protein NUW58_g3427 [Xylaria curta]|uniref:Uncharacterized protein n=1 Tax=Xylaria curta TaxID=42375 RepID=A0ACC1PCQ3_9PEZI|nr:hypothetical protein NUW58_g3427 [Xylaria curta]